MRYVISLSILLFLFGCSTNPNVVKNVDNSMEVFGSIGERKIGLDDKRQIIIQKETSAESELKVQELENYETERKLNLTYEELSQCRQEVSDPRLNGDGKMKSIPEIDDMRTIPEVKEEIGLTKTHELRVVKREFYLERLKLERQYQNTMVNMNKTISRFNRECQAELKFARAKVGLPANRREARGHFEGGDWVREVAAEKTLDDSFRSAK